LLVLANTENSYNFHLFFFLEQFTEFQNESQAKRADRRAELYKEEQKPESDAPIIKSAPTGDAADASSGSEAVRSFRFV
jgi:hypothetical protein